MSVRRLIPDPLLILAALVVVIVGGALGAWIYDDLARASCVRRGGHVQDVDCYRTVAPACYGEGCGVPVTRTVCGWRCVGEPADGGTP